MSAASLLFVPGLRDEVPDHWQTLLARKLAPTRAAFSVPPLGREDLNCARRVEAIETALNEIQGPVILVAHSAGVIMVAHWAARYARDQVVGALLAAPADLDTPMPQGYPTQAALRDGGWLPVPRQRLPFSSIVAVSSNDLLGAQERVEGLARNWGSQCVYLGAVGHLNPASGHGNWPLAEKLIAEVER